MSPVRFFDVSLISFLSFAMAACSSTGGGEGGSGGAGGAGGAGGGGGAGGDSPGCGVALTEATWRDLGEVAAGATAGSVLLVDRDVLVATSRGLFRRPLDGSGPWAPSGLEGQTVRVLYAARASAGVLLAGLDSGEDGFPTLPSIHRSTDGGRTWAPVGEELKIEFESTEEAPVYETVESITSFVRSDGKEVFFANPSGPAVARSEDGDAWSFAFGEPGMFGYPCHLHAPPDAEGVVYQGCEAPLDFAWIRSFGVDEVPLQNPDQRVVTFEELGNRRPNLLTSSPHAPGAIFAGVEGGLLRVKGEEHSWIYLAEQRDEASESGYVYVRSLWLDPCDAQHIVFGGLLNGENKVLQLYETFDDGAQTARVDAPEGLAFDEIRIEAGAAPASGGSFVLALTLVSGEASSAHVLVREHNGITH
jgi:hypothetical protein